MLASLFDEIRRAFARRAARSTDRSHETSAQSAASLLALLREPLPHPKSFNYETVAWMVAAVQSADYMARNMMGARNLVEREALLAFALEQCSVAGLMLEFGVYRGASLSAIAQRAGQVVHGFDSFEGLPEDWTYFQKQGRFGLGGKLPDLKHDNVELHPGWFEQTLPAFLAAHPGPARFIHVDCDLYSSTRCVLEHLTGRLVPGSVIVFDEYLNYPGWEQHEFRAFRELTSAAGWGYAYLGFASAHSAVAVRIVASPGTNGAEA